MQSSDSFWAIKIQILATGKLSVRFDNRVMPGMEILLPIL